MGIWHPFSQEKTAPKPIEIVSGEGAFLKASDGDKYFDAISSWWVNIHGHANKEIAKAIYAQAQTLEQVIFAGFSHIPAERLCQRLATYLPAQLSRFFFSDNGSTAVEVALKMAFQFFKNQGIHRNIFINLEGAYHGDTLGAMSAAGSSSIYHSTFQEFFFKTFSIDFSQKEGEEKQALLKLERFLEKSHNQVCALIVEPLIQGAAGMRMFSPSFLQKISQKVRDFGILVLYDEVMTGFYRTGKMFALDHLQGSFVPDLLCLSKGLTGGFMPLSLTIASEKIYQAFWSDDWKKAFIHGHSYTANPLGCAAALKSLEILERPGTLQNIQMISQIHQRFLKDLPQAVKKRHLGTISAFDVDSPETAQALKDLFCLKNTK